MRAEGVNARPVCPGNRLGHGSAAPAPRRRFGTGAIRGAHGGCDGVANLPTAKAQGGRLDGRHGPFGPAPPPTDAAQTTPCHPKGFPGAAAKQGASATVPGATERAWPWFARGKSARENDGGTGLGVAVGRALARATGGDLRILAPDGQRGGRVQLRLAVTSEATDATGPRSLPGDRAGAERP